MKKSELLDDAKSFALRIVRLSAFLMEKKKDYVLSRQILRAGTSIGANIAEAAYAQTKPDFVTKMTTALKEASETEYWLDLLHRGEFIDDRQFKSMDDAVRSLLARLSASVMTAKRNMRKEKER